MLIKRSMSIILSLTCLAPVSALSAELSAKWPFVFIQRTNEQAAKIGFEPGDRLAIGLFVTQGEAVVDEVIARNARNGFEIELAAVGDLAKLFDENPEKPVIFQHLPTPKFDADEHTGRGEFIIRDAAGNELVVPTPDLDKTDLIPFVTGIAATGDVLTPTISWDIPDPAVVPDYCETVYRVRLLKSPDDQFHRSSALDTESYTIPDGVLTEEDLADSWVRVEFLCNDVDDKDFFAAAEVRSDTHVPLASLQ